MDDPSRATAATVDMSDAVEYHPETGTYRAPLDGRAESVSMAVISVVTTVTDVDPLNMEPLYSVVDPDALDALMTPGPANQSDGDTHVTFTLDDNDVTVSSYGVISVEPGDTTAP